MSKKYLSPLAQGAVFDFAAFLTTRPGTLLSGDTHHAGAMVEQIKNWQEARNLDTTVEVDSKWIEKCHDTDDNLSAQICTLSGAALSEGLQSDHGFAWAWQCNIAMAFVDAGVTHKQGNEGAARVMQAFFGVDVTKFPEYLAFLPQWEK